MQLYEIIISNPQLALILVPILLFSLCLHEYAHARVAYHFKDQTAFRAGRVTLNPLAHLDPVGTLMLFIVGIGWAKPVPVDTSQLRPRKLGNIAVSLAGVTSNFLLIIACALMLKLTIVFNSKIPPIYYNTMIRAFLIAISINTVLTIFNILPIYPLDGHHVVYELLPANQKRDFMQFQRKYGLYILLGILFLPRFLNMPNYLSILVNWVENLVLSIFGLTAA